MKDIFNLFCNHKYRSMVLVALGLTFVISAAGCYELISSYQAEAKRAAIQSSNLSQVLEEQLSGTFTKIDLVMLEIARIIKIENDKSPTKSAEIEALFSERKKVLPEVSSFSVIDKFGNVRFSTSMKKGLYLGDQENFLLESKDAGKDLSDDLHFSKPLISIVSKQPTIYLSRRISNMNNEFVGVVIAGIPAMSFRDFYSKLDIGKEGAILLYSNENILYSGYPWNEKLIGVSLHNTDVIRKIFDNKEKVFSRSRRSQLDGIDRFSSSRRVGETKFAVSVGISKNEVLAGWKKRSALYFIGFALLWIMGGMHLIKFLSSLDELEDQRKMMAYNAKLSSLGEMASGMAHEINNPLAVIATRSMQLKRQIERDQYDPVAFSDSLIKINQTVNRIANIISGLKSFSRNSSGDKFLPTSLKNILENTLELCHEKFRSKFVLLKIDAIPSVLIDARGPQLVQVFLNLLNNAYDAVLNLNEKWIHLAFYTGPDQKITIVITDSGKGIPEKIAQNIMQPFFTTKEIGRGAGLGLPISKGIIEEHGGKIYLDPTASNTRFFIELPAKIMQEDEITLTQMSG